MPDKEYHIMSEVADNENITQRELSKKLGVSVSTINVLMNKMIREGLIKMNQVSQKQVLYMLTPTGMMKKAKKTVSYLKGHYRVIYETKENIKKILVRLDQEHDVIYVLMADDEMGEILAMAVNEFQSSHDKSKVELIYNIKDVNLNEFNSPVLLHINEKEDILINIENCKVINLVERL